MRQLPILLVTMIIAGNMFAQNVDEGRKFLYYERYQSAKETFEKILSSNPNNTDAIYWMGQTLIDTRDSAGAKDLYQKALASNANAPLVLAGMGQILLMEGKKDDARQQFETALNLSKGKDLDVLNAIGRANVRARLGDPVYAIEKLNTATTLKKFNSPYTYLIMGDAYRKLIEGGQAVTAYTKALELDPKYAAAKNSIGKIYETQKNPEYYLPAYEEATQLDPTYAPAYFNLFYHYYFRDINKAGDYLNKFIENMDQGPSIEYIKTDYTYAKGDFAGAKTRAEQLIKQFGDKVNPRMYRMLAYTSDTLGDPNAAKTAMTTFLEKADPETILPDDYEELAKINSKIPGQEAEVYRNYDLAIAKDTVVADKIKMIQKAAALAKATKDRNGEAIWLGKAYALDPDPSARDLYNWAMAHYQAGNYTTSDSLFCNVYISKYPEQIYGYLWCARSKQAQDTTNEKGLAMDSYKLLAQKALELDSAGNLKSTAISSYFSLAAYYNDVAKQKDTAVYYLNQVLKVDPENETAAKFIKILTAPPPKPAPAKPAATKPKTPAKKPK